MELINEQLLYEIDRSANIKSIKALLIAGAAVNVRDKEGNTPLHHSVSTRKVKTVALLLTEGAEVNAENKAGDTPLHYIIMGTMIVMGALRHGPTPSPKDKLEVIKALLAREASVHARNDRGRTPLHYVSSDPEVMEILLAKGASLHALDQEGNTPLHVATQLSRNPRVIEAFLDKGIKINARNLNGMTPLHMAAKFSSFPWIMEALLNKEAIVNVRDRNGKTPLSYVADRHLNPTRYPARELITLLLKQGAYVSKSVQHRLAKSWAYSMEFLPESQEKITITLLVAGISPESCGKPLSQRLKLKEAMIESTVQSWLNPHFSKETDTRINWHKITPKILQALPRVVHFIQSLANRESALQGGYDSSALQPFLFISPQSKDWPHRLSLLEALATRQLPVELMIVIRECLADWVIVDTLISDYKLDAWIAHYLLFEVNEHLEKYIILLQQLYEYDWETPYPITDYIAARQDTYKPNSIASDR